MALVISFVIYKKTLYFIICDLQVRLSEIQVCDIDLFLISYLKFLSLSLFLISLPNEMRQLY